MDKKRLHHFWTKFRRLKPWYFLVLALVSGATCVFALRSNNLGMIRLRDAVQQADKDNGNVEAALQQLRSYVYAHMNTELASGPNAVHPPIQLKYTYERLSQAQQVSTDNSQLYTQAQHYCEQQIPTGVSGRFRLDCIQSYITQHNLQPAPTIPKNLYQFDFVSPRWSPDLAGWSMVVTVLLLLAALATWITDLAIRTVLRRHE